MTWTRARLCGLKNFLLQWGGDIGVVQALPPPFEASDCYGRRALISTIDTSLHEIHHYLLLNPDLDERKWRDRTKMSTTRILSRMTPVLSDAQEIETVALDRLVLLGLRLRYPRPAIPNVVALNDRHAASILRAVMRDEYYQAWGLRVTRYIEENLTRIGI